MRGAGMNIGPNPSKGHQFELIIRTVINEQGQAVSSMKVNGVASAKQIVRALESLIEGVQRQAEKRANDLPN